LSSEALRGLPGVAVFVVGQDLRFRFAYGDALRAAGYAEHDLEGRTLSEVLGPRAAALEPLYRRALAGETLEFDSLAGDDVHEVRAAPVRAADGSVVAATLLSIDVTEQRRAAARLRESEQRGSTLAAALDGAGETFYLLDDQWRFAYINRTAEHFLCGGHPTATSAADLLGVEIWKAFPQTVGRRSNRRSDARVRPVRRRRSTSTTRPFDAWFEVAAKPAPAGLLVQAEDVTELRRSQARLEHSPPTSRDGLPVPRLGGPRVLVPVRQRRRA
jgi:PAS domain-containing protein